jgi:hypothetical protein
MVELKNTRCLILSAMPKEPSELTTIFSERPESIRRKLESPPRLRVSGWDLPSMSPAEFVRGELIRVVERGRQIVELYRDGTFILVGQIHRNFLAWSDKKEAHLHQLALVELIVNFARFYRSVIDDFLVPPQQIEFRTELKNMYLADERTRLGSGPIETSWPLGGGKEAPADSFCKELVVSATPYSPDRTAFLLVQELYWWFGHSEEAIPYTTDGIDGKVIDAEQISRLR